MFPWTAFRLLLALSPVIHAYGTLLVENQCNFVVNLWSVSNAQGPMNILSSNGGTFQETYEINPAGGGISVKITPDSLITDPIMQFEYTLTDRIWYDISNVNGSPFEPYGIELTTSDPTCGSVTCSPDSDCAGKVYQEPDNNYAVMDCEYTADITLVLCPSGGASTSPAPSTSSIEPLPAATYTVAPAPSQTVIVSTTFITYTTMVPISGPTGVYEINQPSPSYNGDAPPTTTITTHITYTSTVDSTTYDTITEAPTPIPRFRRYVRSTCTARDFAQTHRPATAIKRLMHSKQARMFESTRTGIVDWTW